MLALSIPFFSFLSNPFFQMAILASIISSIIGGIVGSYVVIKRISFVTGSISHCVLSGLGFSLWLKHLYNLPGLSTLYGAIVSAVLSHANPRVSLLLLDPHQWGVYFRIRFWPNCSLVAETRYDRSVASSLVSRGNRGTLAAHIRILGSLPCCCRRCI